VPKRISEEDARAILLKNGHAEALEPYPGAQNPWLARCVDCDKEISVLLGTVKAGNRPSHGCPVRRAERSKIKTNPDVAVARFRAKGLKPLEAFPGVNPPWRARCLTCGNEVAPRYANIGSTKTACRYCAGKDVNPVDAAAVMRASSFEPLEPYPGAHVPWACRCIVCGEESTPRYVLVNARGSECRYCKGISVNPIRAEEIVRGIGLEPLEPYPGGHEHWACRCESCGNEVKIRYASINHRGYACVFCSGRSVIRNGIAEQKWTDETASAAMREHNFSPLEAFPGGGAQWLCRCDVCGRESRPRMDGVIGRGRGCRYCSKNTVDEQTVSLVMAAAELEPLEAYKTALSKWHMRCLKCGKEFDSKYNKIQQGGGCPYCATRGLDLEGPAFIYVITHPGFDAHKVGVMGTETSRLRDHGRHGWLTYKTLPVPTGFDAFRIEQGVLNTLRKELGFLPGVDPTDMPQAGWTETVSADDIDLPSLWELVRESADEWLE
jgi:hypothetical protein